ncbi:MAG TPA: hypothetical protein VK474_11975, partial [Chthoniobacterales bacterium]|nr:hypothetical protein [Chthoniobacterales bacterium]
KVLRTTVAIAAKIIPPTVYATAAPFPAAVPAEADRRGQDAGFWFTDTGPPRLSFAELVLQRSLLAHAPPLFA